MNTPTLHIVPSAEVMARAETVTGVTNCYLRMADELAAMVEAEAQRSAQAHAVIADALGELYVALDELMAGLGRGEL